MLVNWFSPLCEQPDKVVFENRNLCHWCITTTVRLCRYMKRKFCVDIAREFGMGKGLLQLGLAFCLAC